MMYTAIYIYKGDELLMCSDHPIEIEDVERITKALEVAGYEIEHRSQQGPPEVDIVNTQCQCALCQDMRGE